MAIMLGFARQQRPLLGVDISSTAVKLIELTQIAGAARYRVDAFAIEPLPINAVVEKRITDVDAVGQGIRRALCRSKTKTKRAACAVAGSAAITKVMSISASLSDVEMETQVQLEAEQYIPYPMEEVNMDFDLIGPSPNDPAMVDLLLVASRRENVDARVSALDSAGLTAEIVDVEAFALEAACSELLAGVDAAGQSPTVAVVDVGAFTTSLQVLQDGKTLYTREQGFGGSQLIDELERRYGLTRALALARLQQNRLPEGFATEVLAPFVEGLAQQIARALQFFYSASARNRADQVLLAGGVACTDRIDVLLEARLGLPVSVANPFVHMAAGPGVDSGLLTRMAPAMMIATGLALRGFD